MYQKSQKRWKQKQKDVTQAHEASQETDNVLAPLSSIVLRKSLQQKQEQQKQTKPRVKLQQQKGMKYAYPIVLLGVGVVIIGFGEARGIVD